MERPGPDQPDDVGAASIEVAALQEAVRAVEGGPSGRSLPDIEAQLVRELRSRDAFMPRDEVHLEARRIADPDWGRKDPVTLGRLLAGCNGPTSMMEEAATEAQWDQVAERLDNALARMSQLRDYSVRTRRTVDGITFEVRIDPWSLRKATKLQRIAAPLHVTVKPL